MITNRDRCHERCITPDESVITDVCVMLVLSIIVRGNNTSRNIHTRANGGITNVTKVMHIRFRPNIRVFDFAKVTHAYTVCQVSTWTTVTERAYPHVVFKNCFF